jgi:mannose-6-phosphate isomerase-like protein (cupin superfamily)
MRYTLTKSADVPQKEKFGIALEIYPDVGDCGMVLVTTDVGHNQEFLDRESTFTYIILTGVGTFYINDEPINIAKGDVLSIPPNNRIYYKGSLTMVLITTPAWKPQNEVETKASVW